MCLVIQVFVSSVALQVVPSFLEKGYEQNEGKRCDVCEEEADLEGGEELREANQEEKEVEEELELVVEHNRNEREQVVLRVVVLVRGKLGRGRLARKPQGSLL